MILITGAAGKTGRAVLQALARRGAVVRALVRRSEQRAAVQNAGATEVVIGDLEDGRALHQAMQGARACYHLCPNMHPDELTIGQRVVRAAQVAGVGHFVYHSVLHPQTEAMPHHWQKLRVEELLFSSGLPFTILQPTAYMQNILAGWPAIRRQGIYAVPYPVESRLSLVDLEDVGEAAATVLSEPGHAGATYELVGTAPLTQLQVATVLTEQLGGLVVAQETPLSDWERNARAIGLGDYAVTTLLQMFRYYAAYGLVGNPNALRWLLGRAPTTLAEFVARVEQRS
jgi:uncharacterized protein YbjT (DUF2867 family)